jgi:hypothetical protein
VARSADHCQPGGILRIRRLALVTSRAGADRIRNRRVLVEALARSPSRARWRSQAVSEVAQPGGQRGGRRGQLQPGGVAAVVDRGQVAGAAGLNCFIRSSTWAWVRWRASRNWTCPLAVLVTTRCIPSSGVLRAWPAWSPAAGYAVVYVNRSNV